MSTIPYQGFSAIDPMKGGQIGNFMIAKRTQDTGSLTDEDIRNRLAFYNQAFTNRDLTPEEQSQQSQLMQEVQARGQRKSGVEQGVIEDIFGQNSGQGAGTNGVSGTSQDSGMNDYKNYLQQILQQQGQSNDLQTNQNNIAQIFNAQRTAGEQAIQDRYVKDRTQAVNELGATGNLNNPSGYASLSGIQAEKNRSLDSLINSLTGAQAGAQIDQNNKVSDRGLNLAQIGLGGYQNLASMGQQGSQFAQNLDLQSKLGRAGLINQARQGSSATDLANRQFFAQQQQIANENALQNRGYDIAEQLGISQAKANKPDFMSTLTGVVGGLGSFGGGVGGLLGGIGKAKEAGLFDSKKKSV